MVILSAAILTKTGKPLVARQYREMSRIKIEGLLTSFSKLVNPGSKNNNAKQHTYIETENVRYVYQPMETIVLLLITTKSSNIVEDLDTLQLLSRIVKDQVAPIDEEHVTDRGIELLFSFDEAIAAIGYAENVTLEQVSTFLEMDSQEANLQEMIMKSKMEDAIQEGKRKAALIAKKKKELEQQNRGFGPQSGGISRDTTDYSAIGGGIAGGSTVSGYKEQPKIGKMGSAAASTSASEAKPKKPVMMSLKSKKKQTNTLLQDLMNAGELETDDTELNKLANESAAMEEGAKQAHAHEVATEDVHIKVEEKISAEINRDGGVSKLDVKGEMFLTVSDPKAANIQVELDKNYKQEFQYKTHPNIDKKLFTDEAIIGVKSGAKKGFPTNNALKILTWRLPNGDDSLLPLNVSCWPSQGSDGLSVSVEYELLQTDMELSNVVISIPLPVDKVNVDQIEHGSYKIDSKHGQLNWQLDHIDASNNTGSFEFSIAFNDDNAIFPIDVNFSSQQTLSHLSVSKVTSLDTKQATKYSSEIVLLASEYIVV